MIASAAIAARPNMAVTVTSRSAECVGGARHVRDTEPRPDSQRGVLGEELDLAATLHIERARRQEGRADDERTR